MPLSAKHFDELFLAVAGNSCDADDFARLQFEIDILDDGHVLVVLHVELVKPENGSGVRERGANRSLGLQILAHHHARHRFWCHIRHFCRTDVAALAQHGDVVGIFGHFAKLVRDHEHAEMAAARELMDLVEYFIGFCGRQHGSWFVKDQDFGIEQQLLDDFHFLLFSGSKCIDRCAQVELERHVFHALFECEDFCVPVDDRRQFRPR